MLRSIPLSSDAYCSLLGLNFTVSPLKAKTQMATLYKTTTLNINLYIFFILKERKKKNKPRNVFSIKEIKKGSSNSDLGLYEQGRQLNQRICESVGIAKESFRPHKFQVLFILIVLFILFNPRRAFTIFSSVVTSHH